MLKKLNEVIGVGRDKRFMEHFFSGVKNLHPEEYSDWDVDIYLQYLFISGLILFKDNTYHLTQKGQDFVIWLAKTGKREDKLF